MPSEEEIVALLRRTKANEPVKFNEYVKFYKEKHPDFYKRKIEPLIKGESKIVEQKPKPMPKPVNPAKELGGQVKPLGSAEVGEELDKKKEEKPKGTYTTTSKDSKEKTQPIKRDNKALKIILIVLGVIVGLAALGAGIYFLFL